MMMQTGMVKQSLNTYRACLDGTETKWQIYRITVPYTRIVCLHQLTIAMVELILGYNIPMLIHDKTTHATSIAQLGYDTILTTARLLRDIT